MRDVTDLFDHFRIVARSVWNTGFWTRPELRTWDSWDQFEQVKELLFKVLVVGRLNKGHRCSTHGLEDGVYLSMGIQAHQSARRFHVALGRAELEHILGTPWLGGRSRILADAFKPHINPLNGKTVGPEGDLKAVVKFASVFGRLV
jgi:hypothetical protein